MIKHFCDNCGVELDNKNKGCGENNLAERKGVKVKLVVVEPNEWPDDTELPEYCKYCLLDVIATNDDRPTCA